MAGLSIIRTNGNTGRQQPSEDGISALCMNGIAVSGGAQLNTVYELFSLADAEQLGLTKAYDLAEKVLVWHRIREFFRLAPNGRLYLMLVSQATTLTQMADVATTNGLAKLLRDPKCTGKVRQAAIARNPATGYIPSNGSSGLDGDVLTNTSGTFSGAIIKAQELAAAEEVLHRPVMIFVEGRGFNGTVGDATDLHLLNCPQVAVTIAQDKDVASLDALFSGYASVECLLGMTARRAVNECVGFVADGNLQDQAKGIYVQPALSSGTLLSGYTAANLSALAAKAYITPLTYAGVAGVYFNRSFTCVLETDDYARIQLNRVIHKAIRLVYAALVPEINRTIKVEPSTGKMTPGMCKYFEEKGEAALDAMANEFSGKSVFCDPNQNVISTSKVTVRISIVPDGTAESIDVFIGFENPFQ
jgi:hypothetical protein